MSSLVLPRPDPRWKSRRRARFAALLLLCAVSPAARAQVALTHTEDAAPIPKGMLRFRVTTGWTRFDERFTATGRRTLADEIATDSLGPRQLPSLAPFELALGDLTGDPRTRLSLGRLAAGSDARIVTTPIVLEYGLTRRLSVGVMVPVVQTRRAINVTVDSAATRDGNVSYLAIRQRREAAAANASVATAFRQAADSLGRLIAQCPATPTAGGCAAVNANAPDAAAARLQALRFAQAVQTLGVDSASVVVAPKASSALAQAIDARRQATNELVRKYLGAGAGSTLPVFTASNHFSYVDLQGRNGVPGLLQRTGLDSLHTVERQALAGFTIGAQFLAIDGFSRDSVPRGGLQARLVAGGSYRFSNLRVDSAARRGVIPPGEGNGVELRSALDLLYGRLGATIAARGTKSFARTVEVSPHGDPDAFYPYPVFGSAQRTEGTVIAVDVTPRIHVGEWLSLDALYGFERTGAPTHAFATRDECAACGSFPPFGARTTAVNAQRAGFGIRYSTVDAFLRGRTRMPLEVSFDHLETITGDAGVPKLSRDQIQVRLYFRLRSGR